MTREEILEEARSYVGVAWRHQGRTREHGIDCVGLPVLVGQAFDLWTPISAEYPRRPDGTFIRHFRDYMNSMRIDQMQEADVLIFSDIGHPCHCGILSEFRGGPGVIHAHAGLKKVMEQSLESALPSIGRPIHVFSFPGLEE